MVDKNLLVLFFLPPLLPHLQLCLLLFEEGIFEAGEVAGQLLLSGFLLVLFQFVGVLIFTQAPKPGLPSIGVLPKWVALERAREVLNNFRLTQPIELGE